MIRSPLQNFMGEWVNYYRKRVRHCEKMDVKLADLPDKPFLTFAETAACLGISCRTLCDWVRLGVIDRPRGWRKWRRRLFRRDFVRMVREAMVIWKSTPGMRRQDFHRLCHKMAWGYR